MRNTFASAALVVLCFTLLPHGGPVLVLFTKDSPGLRSKRLERCHRHPLQSEGQRCAVGFLGPYCDLCKVEIP